MIKKVEVLANIAVIVTSVVLCSVLVRKYLFSSNEQTLAAVPRATASALETSPSKRGPRPGTKISLPGVDWNKNILTIVLALSTTCHFCSESAPFYRDLVKQKPGNVGLIAVLPQPLDDSRNYLNKLRLNPTDVIQNSASSIGLTGTPTLLLVDNNGTIIGSWVGKLSNTQTEEVIERIRQ